MGNRKWSNWSGRVRCAPERIEIPSGLEELQRTVREGNSPIRVVGSGHSFSDIVATDGTLLSLDAMQGVFDVNREMCEATVWAGTKLWRLNHLLAEHGLAMPNLGDINVQSIAGAVSTGTHGTGIEFGCLSTFIQSVTLVTADGEIVECAPGSDTLKAVAVSVGALGVLAKVRLKLVPSYRLHYVADTLPVREAIEQAESFARECRHYEFFVFPHTSMAMAKWHRSTSAPPSTRPAVKWVDEVLLENMCFGLVGALGRINSRWCPAISRFTARTANRREEIDDGHRVLSTRRLVRFNEMEYALPAEHGPEALHEILRLVESRRFGVSFPIEYRFVKGDDLWLSPFYGRDSVTISLHQFRGMDYHEYFHAAEQVFRKYDGRPHWGKLHSLSSDELEASYPKWGDFHTLRLQLDPHGRFLNPHLRDLFGTRHTT
ncbi:MAG: FAD-binding protein [Candidatus Hydrogenedentes bacterium]|nr:FAD-binding protein [Candidatus Hydrogenedentota bacterium]